MTDRASRHGIGQGLDMLYARAAATTEYLRTVINPSKRLLGQNGGFDGIAPVPTAWATFS